MDTLNRIELSHSTPQNLPSEVLDWILMKSLYFTEYEWVKRKQYVSDDALLRSVVRLQSVSSAWMIRLNGRWFRIVYNRSRKDIDSALSSRPVLVSRKEWNARVPTSTDALYEPVPIVVIIETIFQPGECLDETREYLDETSCLKAVRYKQDYYMDVKGWADIPYNFLIGEDGRVYEGRGWKVHAAHTGHYNDSSLGIGFIGIFDDRAPCDASLRATHQLIRLGVKEGHIAHDYSLIGHRDLRPTSTSPGKYLYEIIKSWPNYSSMEL